MKAMLLNRPRPVAESPLALVEMVPPLPGPGEIQIRVEACGVCHTDLHTVEGELPLPQLPLIPGHQIVGTVTAAGAGAGRFRPGEQVGVPWLYATCGACSFCQQGRENLCAAARFTGYHVNGGYAEYVVAPEAFAFPLPAGFSAVEMAPLLCAGIIGFRALRLSEVRPGQRLGLYGFGASAHIAIQIARHWGCEVYVFTRSPEHRALAQKLGAVWVGGAEDTPPKLYHSAIIFAPAGRLVGDALKSLEKGGTIALAGIYMSPIPEIDYRWLYQERGIRSVANSTRQDAQDLLRLAEEIPIRTEVEVFPLEEANHVLRLLKESRLRGAGVLSVPTD